MKVTPTNTSLRAQISRAVLKLRNVDHEITQQFVYYGGRPDWYERVTAIKEAAESEAIAAIEAFLTAKTTEAREQAWQAGYNQGVVDGKHSMTGEHNPDTDTEQLQQLDKGEA